MTASVLPNCPYPADWLRQHFPDITGARPLGRGGQKWALHGTHKTFGDVVLKLFHPNADPKRVEREIEAIRALNSPNIPAIHAFGVVNFQGIDTLWLIEQLVQGDNLRQRLQGGPLPVSRTLELGIQLLEVLDAAERQRIVHRDIKPENIVVSADLSRCWLLDFGLVRHLELTSLTPTVNPYGVGTPGYAPREQWLNLKAEIDTRSDLFALGVTLYECLTGQNPYLVGVANVAEVLQRIQSTELPALGKQGDGFDDFRDLVLVMGRSKISQRIATAAEALIWAREILMFS